LPEDENQSFNNAEADPEEMTKQHVEEGAEQGDVQPDDQCSTKDDQVPDVYPPKYTFPPGWCDVSGIPSTGWD
jgi:helicase MOV-10